MRTLAEGSMDRARAKRTPRGQGLRPPAVTRRAASETKWTWRPIPLSPWERGNGIETKWTSCPIPLSPWEKKWALQTLKKRQNTHKLVIFGTFMVKKWIFVIKMYSFWKIMIYLFTWTYQRGALICLRNSERPSKYLTINETIGTVRNGFGVLGVYSEVSHSNS